MDQHRGKREEYTNFRHIQALLVTQALLELNEGNGSGSDPKPAPKPHPVDPGEQIEKLSLYRCNRSRRVWQVSMDDSNMVCSDDVDLEAYE